jgi:hypothetical protein
VRKPPEKTAHVPLPDNWNQDSYLEIVLTNGWKQQSVFAASYPARWQLLKETFDVVTSLSLTTIGEKEPYAAAMIHHAALSWATACQIFLLGKLTETYPIIRMSVEASALAYSFMDEPSLIEHWKLSLHEDSTIAKEAMKALKKGMYSDAMESRLKKAGDEILSEYKRITGACNEAGSHANPLAVTSRFVHRNGHIAVVPTPIDTMGQLHVLAVLITAGALIFNLALECSGENNPQSEETILKILESLAADVTSPESEKFIADSIAELSATAVRMKAEKK